MVRDMKNLNFVLPLIFCSPFANQAIAQTSDTCFMIYSASLPPETTVGEIRAKCADQGSVALPDRIQKELTTQYNPFVITPHRMNYILPFTHNFNPNQEPWDVQEYYPGVDNPIEQNEAKLQISLKVPLNYEDMLFEDDNLYFGFTLKSFWQVYNDELSAPFRDSNYRPEIFYQAPIPYPNWGGTFITRVGLEHESNGRAQSLSRSWNRVYIGLGFQKDNWLIYAQPWYRLDEDEKVDDGDPNTPPPPKGDDNPDIEDFYGHFELSGVYAFDHLELSAMVRQNFSTGKGAFETNISFPLWGRLQGMVQYFDGYGESLIDYNARVQRLGVGIMLTNPF